MTVWQDVRGHQGGGEGAQSARRWIVAALMVAGAHGAIAWRLAALERAPVPVSLSAAIEIDLAPVTILAAPPAQTVEAEPEASRVEPEAPPDLPSKVEPEPPMPEPEQAAHLPELASPEPVAPAPAEPVSPDPTPSAPMPDLKPAEAVVPSEPPASAASVAVPPPEPPKPAKRAPMKPQPKKPFAEAWPKPAKVPAPPPGAPNPAAPAAASPTESPVAARAAWQRTVQDHIAQHRRNSPGIGRAAVTFAVNRLGRIVSVRLNASSGNAELDGEAVAMVERSNPLPPVPPEIPGGTIVLTVPINFH